jgi:ATP/maltotriose-dependent transcriptional regulator MalT
MTHSIRPQGSLAFLPQMERSIDSLYTALDTLLATEQFETAFHLAGSLYPYWETYENLADGIGWLLKLLGPEAGKRFHGASGSSVYAMLGNLLRHQSEYERAAAYYELGLDNLREQPDYRVHTFILGGLGEIAFRQGQYEAATDFYQSYLEIGRQAGDDRYVADAFNALGRLATVKGDFALALEYHQHGRHLCEATDYRTGLAWMFNALGELERARGEFANATVHFQESAAIFDRLGNLGAQRLALQNLAFALLRDYPSSAETLLQKTLHFWRRGPARHGMSLSMIGLSRVDISRGNMKKVRRQLSSATHVLSEIGVQLELGDRVDYEIALERLKKGIGYDPLRFEGVDVSGFSVLRDVSSRDFSKATTLTKQEMAVLRLAAQGCTDKQIAGQLVISPHTVNAHLKSIYRKLSVNNRTSAVAAARSRHIM